TREQEFDEHGKPDEEHDPTQINMLIRQILRKFAKSTYVGYTATPFANIYIHDRGETKTEGPDLFPRSFIINLPAPSNYDGPVRIFGLEASDDERAVQPLPLVRVLDEYAEHTETPWLPQGHKNGHRPHFGGEDQLPPSMIEAMRAFILVCATRRARGQMNAHNSMLVHVTRFTSVQNMVRKQVETELSSIKRRIRYDSAASGGELAELEKLWKSDFEPTSATFRAFAPERDFKSVTWKEVLAHVPDAVEIVQVKTINGKASDILDYDTHKSVGLNVIAIGGDKLARGLTLEGLSVSYFLRASRMYDTLMQMGRWFGYRPGYLDLCRLYMTKELRDWFCHITEASEELRREFDHMALLNQTPKDYGLKVRS
ncbi:MAG: Z1 domain-containing protein, partial [Hyphomicrobium sp.]